MDTKLKNEEIAEMVNTTKNKLEEKIDPPWASITFNELSKKEFKSIDVIIGTKKNAILVRKESLLISGHPSVGKSLFTIEMAMRLAAGIDVFGWKVSNPLKILIFQSEVVLEFVQDRMNKMREGFQVKGINIHDSAMDNIIIYDELSPIKFNDPDHLGKISKEVGKIKPDIIIFDPFLTYFKGNENDNNEVRDALDNLRSEIAGKHNCALIITDHKAKTDFGTGVRGAGAKLDWAATVINLSKFTDNKLNVDGKLIKMELSKVRYGWEPDEPTMLLRDRDFLTCEIFESEKISPKVVASIIKQNGGEVPNKGELRQLLIDSGISSRKASDLIDQAEKDHLVDVAKGARNASIYKLPSKIASEFVGYEDESCSA